MSHLRTGSGIYVVTQDDKEPHTFHYETETRMYLGPSRIFIPANQLPDLDDIDSIVDTRDSLVTILNIADLIQKRNSDGENLDYPEIPIMDVDGKPMLLIYSYSLPIPNDHEILRATKLAQFESDDIPEDDFSNEGYLDELEIRFLTLLSVICNGYERDMTYPLQRSQILEFIDNLDEGGSNFYSRDSSGIYQMYVLRLPEKTRFGIECQKVQFLFRKLDPEEITEQEND